MFSENLFQPFKSYDIYFQLFEDVLICLTNNLFTKTFEYLSIYLLKNFSFMITLYISVHRTYLYLPVRTPLSSNWPQSSDIVNKSNWIPVSI